MPSEDDKIEEALQRQKDIVQYTINEESIAIKVRSIDAIFLLAIRTFICQKRFANWMLKTRTKIQRTQDFELASVVRAIAIDAMIAAQLIPNIMRW